MTGETYTDEEMLQFFSDAAHIVRYDAGDRSELLNEFAPGARWSGDTVEYSRPYGGMVVVAVDEWRDECLDAAPPIRKGFRGYQAPENRFIERKRRVR